MDSLYEPSKFNNWTDRMVDQDGNDVEVEISQWLKLESDPYMSIFPDSFNSTSPCTLLDTVEPPTSSSNTYSSCPPPFPREPIFDSVSFHSTNSLPIPYAYDSTYRDTSKYIPSFSTYSSCPSPSSTSSNFIPFMSSSLPSSLSRLSPLHALAVKTERSQSLPSSRDFHHSASETESPFQNYSHPSSHEYTFQFPTSDSNGRASVMDLKQFSPPQLNQMFSRYIGPAHNNRQSNLADQSMVKVEDEGQAKKRLHTVVRRVRQTRPKVVESKGGLQCKGRNRKKNIQCRNAALMEYVGPRPIYCAEHIELDPNSLYEKCRSSYQKERGDNKGCKEVVLKEFGVCYKHYGDLVGEFVQHGDQIILRTHQERIIELLCSLEKEASAAKKKDCDLYQRKNKLIPKFLEMKKVITSAAQLLGDHRDACSYISHEYSASSSPASSSDSSVSTPAATFSPSFATQVSSLGLVSHHQIPSDLISTDGSSSMFNFSKDDLEVFFYTGNMLTFGQ